MAEASTTLSGPRAGTESWREIVRRYPLPTVGAALLVGLAAGRTLGPGGSMRAGDGSILRPQEAALMGKAIQALVAQARSWLEDMERRMKEGR